MFYDAVEYMTSFFLQLATIASLVLGQVSASLVLLILAGFAQQRSLYKHEFRFLLDFQIIFLPSSQLCWLIRRNNLEYRDAEESEELLESKGFVIQQSSN
jgi:hypothetical protein